MRIFVTGATGYIGGAVTRALRERDHEVVALVRSPASAEKVAGRGVTALRGDVGDPSSWANALRDVDAVIHTAVGMNGGVKEPDFAAADAMIEALEGTDKPLVLTTGGAVYLGLPVTVADEATPLDAAIPPQVPRVKLEQRVLAATARGVRTIVLRPAHAYGRGSAGIFTRMQLEHAKGTGVAPYIGDGARLMGFVHVDDLADAYVAALEKAHAGSVYNVLSATLTLREVAESVSWATGGEGKTRSIPLEEAAATWGPLGPLLAQSPAISALRVTKDLGFTARRPSFQWELVNGSLRTA